MTKKDLQEELKQSMLSKNELKTSVLRLLLSAINYYEIQKGGAGYEATDEDVLSVMQRETKQRRDSIEEFTKAERLDLADKEKKELEILLTYLPEQMNEEELGKIIDEAISQTNASGMQDMGKVMGLVSQNAKGKADMGQVSKIVREKLSP